MPPDLAPDPDLHHVNVGEEVALARAAQSYWSARPLSHRLAIVRRFRHQLALAPERLMSTVRHSQRRSDAETLLAEVLTLADACKHLERTASRLLRPRRLHRGRPTWLAGSALEVRREALGVVLIVGPSNYPLMLPGVQALQALVAGNAVILKPGRDASAAALECHRLWVSAGLPAEVLRVVSEEPANVAAALRSGVDKVIVTGSADTGAAVLAQAAPHLVPSVMELSGCDVVLVRDDADVELAARAVRFGLLLNSGATCIAPRRLVVHAAVAGAFEAALKRALSAAPAVRVDAGAARRANDLVAEALARGARIVSGRAPLGESAAPLVLADASPQMRLLQADVFAPVAAMVVVRDDDEAIVVAGRCPYALGASVFGSPREATRLARRLHAGCVVVNDMIAPTADPRVPFGGRGRSGFGVTRGDEGLLEMTALKVVAVRSGKFRPHYDEPLRLDDAVLREYLQAAHGSRWTGRIAAACRLLRGLVRSRHGAHDEHP